MIKQRHPGAFPKIRKIIGESCILIRGIHHLFERMVVGDQDRLGPTNDCLPEDVFHVEAARIRIADRGHLNGRCAKVRVHVNDEHHLPRQITVFRQEICNVCWHRQLDGFLQLFCLQGVFHVHLGWL